MAEHMRNVAQLREARILRTDRVEDTLVKINPECYNHQYNNICLPAQVLEILQSRLTDSETILCIGHKSAYVMSCMCRSYNKTVNIDLICFQNNETDNFRKHIDNIHVGQKWEDRVKLSWADEAETLISGKMFNAIYIGGVLPDVPKGLKAHLKIGGRMVLHFSHHMVAVDRLGWNDFSKRNILLSIKCTMTNVPYKLQIELNTNDYIQVQKEENGRALSPAAYEDLVNILECPVCLNILEPPVSLCNRGHSVCGKCRPSNRNCPTCRGGMSKVQSLALNQVLQVEHTCSGSMYGCTATEKFYRLKVHEEKCDYNKFTICRIARCRARVRRRLLELHVSNEHATLVSRFEVPGKFVDEIDISDWDNLDKVLFFRVESTKCLFEYYCKTLDEYLYVAVTCYGDESQRFELDLTLFSDKRKDRILKTGELLTPREDFCIEHSYTVKVKKDTCLDTFSDSQFNVECFIGELWIADD